MRVRPRMASALFRDARGTQRVHDVPLERLCRTVTGGIQSGQSGGPLRPGGSCGSQSLPPSSSNSTLRHRSRATTRVGGDRNWSRRGHDLQLETSWPPGHPCRWLGSTIALSNPVLPRRSGRRVGMTSDVARSAVGRGDEWSPWLQFRPTYCSPIWVRGLGWGRIASAGCRR